MDIQRLREGPVKDRMRSALGEIFIKDGITQKEMCAQAKISKFVLSAFLSRTDKYKVGITALIKIAHYLDSRGFDVKQLVNPPTMHQG